MKSTAEVIHNHEERDLMAAKSACLASPPPLPEGPPWPSPLAPEALHGLAGEIIASIEPHTEADPAALLLQLLIGFGSVVGRGPYHRVGADQHRLNLFGVLVGPTAMGRKGTAWSVVRHLLEAADPDWANKRITSGLSSGEGVIWACRDAIEEQEPIREPRTRKVTGYQTVTVDTGVDDKRLMVVESEFASALRVSERDGSTLTAVLRQAWDHGTLRILTRNKAATATGAYISLVGHVTKDELLKYLNSTEAGNGFGNRFLWCCVRRSKLLPEGGNLGQVNLAPILRRIEQAVRFARTAGELQRDPEARELWSDVYAHLTRERLGLFGAVTGRAAPITLRLSMLYALLDCSAEIRVPHLTAALEVWRYCEDSARFIFGSSLGDQTADAIMQGLRDNPDGLSRQEISERLFGRNKRADEITRALRVLALNGLARAMQRDTGGRPAEVWSAI
jgi:hypothetical protein